MLWQVHTSNLFFVLLSGIPLSGSKICSSVHQLKHAQVHSRFLVVQNKAAINIYIQVSQRNFISLLWSYWVCDKCMFNFIRNWQTVTNVAGPFCLPTSDGWEFPSLSIVTSCWYYWVFVCFVLSTFYFMLQLNNNIVIVSGVHQSDLVIPVSLLFQILLGCYIILSRAPCAIQ